MQLYNGKQLYAVTGDDSLMLYFSSLRFFFPFPYFTFVSICLPEEEKKLWDALDVLEQKVIQKMYSFVLPISQEFSLWPYFIGISTWLQYMNKIIISLQQVNKSKQHLETFFFCLLYL